MAAAEAAITIWHREVLRFLRERNRVIGALAQPLLFWLVIGTGIGTTFRPVALADGFDYLAFMYPGVIGLAIMFTAVFSTISIIADRDAGFLRAILAAPVHRSSIVVGKVLGGTTVALLQGVILLLLAPLVGFRLQLTAVLGLLLLMAVIAFALTALGTFIAWPMKSTQGFHMIMNLLLLPMWLVSGAIFPVSGVPPWMEGIMRVNPLTYGVDGLRGALYAGRVPYDAAGIAEAFVLYGYGLNLTVMAGFGLLMIVLTTWTAGRRA